MPKLCAIAFCLAALTLPSLPLPAQQTADPFSSLRLYNGNWTVAMHDQGKTHIDHLVNQCSAVGQYYVCQQTINGKVGALVVFVPAESGHYYVNNLLPDGTATGRTELTIAGPHWVYQSNRGTTGPWFRTTNDFTGTTKIHFEMQASADGKTWKTTGSGDEVHQP